MNIFLYIIIFIIGISFGSFYSLAIYRIPKRVNIVTKHSFCPNCGHKLGVLELIPIFSYIFLRGKCKHCKQKIKPRYFILELLSGLIFVIIAFCLKIDIYNLSLDTIIRFIFIILYLTFIFLIAGIDKDYRKIEKNVLCYGIVIACFYVIYICIISQTNIYKYVLYLVTLIILLILDNIKQLKEAKDSYVLDILMLIVVMLINTDIIATAATILIVTCAIAIVRGVLYLRNALNKFKKENKKVMQTYKLGYLLCIANILLFIEQLYLIYY